MYELFMLEDYILAGKIHSNILEYVRNLNKDGMNIFHLRQIIETKILEYPNSGIAFPVGINVNKYVAHYSPFSNCDIVLKQGDKLNIDFGVHINGCICDSGYTEIVGQDDDEGINIVKETVKIAIDMCRPDQNIADIGETVNEYVKSFDYNCITDLCGHNLKPWIIHAGKYLPSFKMDAGKIEEGDYLAVEYFITKGKNKIIPTNHISHYCYNYFKSPNKNKYTIIKEIYKKFKSLPFHKEWFNNTNLKEFVDNEYLLQYPALISSCNSYHWENTIYIGENTTKMISYTM